MALGLDDCVGHDVWFLLLIVGSSLLFIVVDKLIFILGSSYDILGFPA
jgi:hypothetical protein